jgi:hypothetical protein
MPGAALAKVAGGPLNPEPARAIARPPRLVRDRRWLGMMPICRCQVQSCAGPRNDYNGDGRPDVNSAPAVQAGRYFSLCRSSATPTGAPKLQASANSEVNVAIQDGFKGFVRGLVRYQGTREDANSGIRTQPQTTIDAFAGLKDAGRRRGFADRTEPDEPADRHLRAADVRPVRRQHRLQRRRADPGPRSRYPGALRLLTRPSRRWLTTPGEPARAAPGQAGATTIPPVPPVALRFKPHRRTGASARRAQGRARTVVRHRRGQRRPLCRGGVVLIAALATRRRQ